MIRFAYQSILSKGTRPGTFEIIHRPIIPIRIFGAVGSDEDQGLVDTGSDDTLFPEHFIDKLGIFIPPGDHAVIAGIDGSMTVVRYGMVDLAIPGAGGGYRWSARVGFHAGHRIALGHGGFLEYFTANFNGRGRHLTLTPNGNARPSVHP